MSPGCVGPCVGCSSLPLGGILPLGSEIHLGSWDPSARARFLRLACLAVQFPASQRAREVVGCFWVGSRGGCKHVKGNGSFGDH